MLVCPKCNTKNRIGAIFCRDCGEKLDVADMRTPKGSDAPGGIRKGRLIRILFSLLVLVAIAYIGVALFTPLELAEGAVASDRADELWRNYERVAESADRTAGQSFTLNSAEASMLFNRILTLEDEDPEAVSGALVPVKVFIELLPENRVKAVIRYKVFNRLTSDTVLEGRVEVSEETGQVEFIPEAYQLGTLPMKWQLESLVMGRFHQQFSGRSDLNRARKRVRSLDIERNRATVRVKSN